MGTSLLQQTPLRQQKDVERLRQENPGIKAVVVTKDKVLPLTAQMPYYMKEFSGIVPAGEVEELANELPADVLVRRNDIGGWDMVQWELPTLQYLSALFSDLGYLQVIKNDAIPDGDEEVTIFGKKYWAAGIIPIKDIPVPEAVQADDGHLHLTAVPVRWLIADQRMRKVDLPDRLKKIVEKTKERIPRGYNVRGEGSGPEFAHAVLGVILARATINRHKGQFEVFKAQATSRGAPTVDPEILNYRVIPDPTAPETAPKMYESLKFGPGMKEFYGDTGETPRRREFFEWGYSSFEPGQFTDGQANGAFRQKLLVTLRAKGDATDPKDPVFNRLVQLNQELKVTPSLALSLMHPIDMVRLLNSALNDTQLIGRIDLSKVKMDPEAAEMAQHVQKAIAARQAPDPAELRIVNRLILLAGLAALGPGFTKNIPVRAVDPGHTPVKDESIIRWEELDANGKVVREGASGGRVAPVHEKGGFRGTQIRINYNLDGKSVRSVEWTTDGGVSLGNYNPAGSMTVDVTLEGIAGTQQTHLDRRSVPPSALGLESQLVNGVRIWLDSGKDPDKLATRMYDEFRQSVPYLDEDINMAALQAVLKNMAGLRRATGPENYLAALITNVHDPRLRISELGTKSPEQLEQDFDLAVSRIFNQLVAPTPENNELLYKGIALSRSKLPPAVLANIVGVHDAHSLANLTEPVRIRVIHGIMEALFPDIFKPRSTSTSPKKRAELESPQEFRTAGVSSGLSGLIIAAFMIAASPFSRKRLDAASEGTAASSDPWKGRMLRWLPLLLLGFVLLMGGMTPLQAAVQAAVHIGSYNAPLALSSGFMHEWGFWEFVTSEIIGAGYIAVGGIVASNLAFIGFSIIQDRKNRSRKSSQGITRRAAGHVAAGGAVAAAASVSASAQQNQQKKAAPGSQASTATQDMPLSATEVMDEEGEVTIPLYKVDGNRRIFMVYVLEDERPADNQRVVSAYRLPQPLEIRDGSDPYENRNEAFKILGMRKADNRFYDKNNRLILPNEWRIYNLVGQLIENRSGGETFADARYRTYHAYAKDIQGREVKKPPFEQRHQELTFQVNEKDPDTGAIVPVERRIRRSFDITVGSLDPSIADRVVPGSVAQAASYGLSVDDVREAILLAQREGDIQGRMVDRMVNGKLTRVSEVFDPNALIQRFLDSGLNFDPNADAAHRRVSFDRLPPKVLSQLQNQGHLNPNDSLHASVMFYEDGGVAVEWYDDGGRKVIIDNGYDMTIAVDWDELGNMSRSYKVPIAPTSQLDLKRKHLLRVRADQHDVAVDRVDEVLAKGPREKTLLEQLGITSGIKEEDLVKVLNKALVKENLLRLLQTLRYNIDETQSLLYWHSIHGDERLSDQAIVNRNYKLLLQVIPELIEPSFRRQISAEYTLRGPETAGTRGGDPLARFDEEDLKNLADLGIRGPETEITVVEEKLYPQSGGIHAKNSDGSPLRPNQSMSALQHVLYDKDTHYDEDAQEEAFDDQGQEKDVKGVRSLLYIAPNFPLDAPLAVEAIDQDGSFSLVRHDLIGKEVRLKKLPGETSIPIAPLGITPAVKLKDRFGVHIGDKTYERQERIEIEGIDGVKRPYDVFVYRITLNSGETRFETYVKGTGRVISRQFAWSRMRALNVQSVNAGEQTIYYDPTLDIDAVLYGLGAERTSQPFSENDIDGSEFLRFLEAMEYQATHSLVATADPDLRAQRTAHRRVAWNVSDWPNKLKKLREIVLDIDKYERGNLGGFMAHDGKDPIALSEARRRDGQKLVAEFLNESLGDPQLVNLIDTDGENFPDDIKALREKAKEKPNSLWPWEYWRLNKALMQVLFPALLAPGQKPQMTLRLLDQSYTQEDGHQLESQLWHEYASDVKAERTILRTFKDQVEQMPVVRIVQDFIEQLKAAPGVLIIPGAIATLLTGSLWLAGWLGSRANVRDRAAERKKLEPSPAAEPSEESKPGSPGETAPGAEPAAESPAEPAGPTLLERMQKGPLMSRAKEHGAVETDDSDETVIRQAMVEILKEFGLSEAMFTEYQVSASWDARKPNSIIERILQGKIKGQAFEAGTEKLPLSSFELPYYREALAKWRRETDRDSGVLNSEEQQGRPGDLGKDRLREIVLNEWIMMELNWGGLAGSSVLNNVRSYLVDKAIGMYNAEHSPNGIDYRQYGNPLQIAAVVRGEVQALRDVIRPRYAVGWTQSGAISDDSLQATSDVLLTLWNPEIRAFLSGISAADWRRVADHVAPLDSLLGNINLDSSDIHRSVFMQELGGDAREDPALVAQRQKFLRQGMRFRNFDAIDSNPEAFLRILNIALRTNPRLYASMLDYNDTDSLERLGLNRPELKPIRSLLDRATYGDKLSDAERMRLNRGLVMLLFPKATADAFLRTHILESQISDKLQKAGVDKVLTPFSRALQVMLDARDDRSASVDGARGKFEELYSLLHADRLNEDEVLRAIGLIHTGKMDKKDMRETAQNVLRFLTRSYLSKQYFPIPFHVAPVKKLVVEFLYLYKVNSREVFVGYDDLNRLYAKSKYLNDLEGYTPEVFAIGDVEASVFRTALQPEGLVNDRILELMGVDRTSMSDLSNNQLEEKLLLALNTLLGQQDLHSLLNLEGANLSTLLTELLSKVQDGTASEAETRRLNKALLSLIYFNHEQLRQLTAGTHTRFWQHTGAEQKPFHDRVGFWQAVRNAGPVLLFIFIPALWAIILPILLPQLWNQMAWLPIWAQWTPLVIPYVPLHFVPAAFVNLHVFAAVAVYRSVHGAALDNAQALRVR